MKKLIFIFILLYSLNCFGQSETKEDFINKIFKTIYNSGDTYYLLDTAQNYGFNLLDSMQIIPSTRGIIDSTILFQLIANSTKLKSEKWKCAKFNNIKCINKESKIYSRITSKGVNLDDEILFCSNPVYNDNYDFIMVRIGRICGKNCGDSCVYFFRKIKGKWEMILKTFCIVV